MTRLEALEKGAGGYVKCLGNIEESFVEQPALAPFHLDEHVSGHVGGVCHFLLRQSPFQANCPDPGPDRNACHLPLSCAVGIMLAGTCRHALSHGVAASNVCTTSCIFVCGCDLPCR